jgi:transposase
MTKVTMIAGIDISKQSFDVCALVHGKEQVKRFAYNKEGLKALIKWLPQGVLCVMEATGPYYLKLACFLYQQGIEVSVVNPLVIKRFSQMRLLRAKTDRADAKLIARYALSEQPPVWQPPAPYQIKLQQLEALLHGLQKQQTASTNQLEAFEATGFMSKTIKQLFAKLLTDLQKQIAGVTKKMEALTKEHQGGLLTNLVSIPGIG